jgi:hypothetical protein
VSRVGSAGAPPGIARATLFNPDYTRRAEPRHDTCELRDDDGQLRVAQLLLVFRYRNQSALPPGAPPPTMTGAGVRDLAIVQWLETNARDTAYAAAHNGTRTFHVACTCALRAIVPVRWLVQSRLVVPCGMHLRLAGAFWVCVVGRACKCSGTATGRIYSP